MKEVLFVTEVQSLQKLLHQGSDVALAESHKSGLQKPHQIVVHVFEHQIESSFNKNFEGFKCETRFRKYSKNKTIRPRALIVKKNVL